jgi:hypothetical protein
VIVKLFDFVVNCPTVYGSLNDHYENKVNFKTFQGIICHYSDFNITLWLISFMNDILSSARLPKLFKRTKAIAIPKPGKDGSDPEHYRPFSLLSVMDRLILQHIQLLIEAATLVHQAGFRKHRSCTDQVMALSTQI